MEINQELIDTLMELGSVWGLRVVGALAVLVVGRIVCGVLRRATRRTLERSGVDESLVPFVASLVYYASLAVVLIAVLNLFGIQTASVIAVLGAASLAVGLAMQGTLSNFAAGVMLLLFRPFKIGDYIEVAGTAGGVFEIGIFSTTLHTPDNVKIIVPNSAIYGDTVKNYSANETRRNDFVIGISYDDDIGVAISTRRKGSVHEPVIPGGAGLGVYSMVRAVSTATTPARASITRRERCRGCPPLGVRRSRSNTRAATRTWGAPDSS